MVGRFWRRDYGAIGARYEFSVGRWHFSAIRLKYTEWRFALSVSEGALYWRHWSFNLGRAPRHQHSVDIYVPEPASDGL